MLSASGNVVLEKLGASVITYGELIYRARKSKHSSMALEQLHELVNLLPPFPLPEIAAESYGTIRAQLEGGGESIGNNELWIARPTP